MNPTRGRICGHFCILSQICWGLPILVEWILSLFWNISRIEPHLTTSLLPPSQTTVVFAPNRFPASLFASCAVYSSQNKLKMVRLCPISVQTFHWLLISLRIKYKFPTEAIKTLHGMALSLAPYHAPFHSSFSSYTSLLAVSHLY